jgi:uncharacterized protein DUF4440
MKVALLAIAFLIVAPTSILGQGSPTAELYKSGDPPQCNIPFAREFGYFMQDLADDFTQRRSNPRVSLADEFTSTWPNGEVLDKKEFINLRANSNLRIKRINVVQDQSYNACLYGYLAVVTGTYVMEAKLTDRDLNGQYRFTAVFVKRPGFWQLVALHSSRLLGQQLR